MKLIAPKPFTIEAGKRAVLLLHGFTGNTNDVKRLGKYLSDRNYTVHAPLYKGHGGGPDLLIQSNPTEWWNSVIEGYDELKSRGYEEIAEDIYFEINRLTEEEEIEKTYTLAQFREMSNPGDEESTYNLAGVIDLTVLNYQGLTLPSTGGMGTLLFTILGILVMMIALVVVVSKRRKMEYEY